jgi:hypothetical protein
MGVVTVMPVGLILRRRPNNRRCLEDTKGLLVLLLKESLAIIFKIVDLIVLSKERALNDRHRLVSDLGPHDISRGVCLLIETFLILYSGQITHSDLLTAHTFFT